MNETRAAIAAIHNHLKGEIAGLQERLEESPDDETDLQLKGEFTHVTATAVWEALYTLADRIDRLGS
jgi:hypothetical protein